MTRRSVLHTQHEELGARFVDFGGWDMPVRYDSVLAEHQAVRTAVGVFDVSHLGRLSVTGGLAGLQGLFTNDLLALEPGRTQYTLLLNDDGGIVDDILIWRWDDDSAWILPNAANSDRVKDLLVGQGLDVSDLRETTAFLAIQGPAAPDLLEEVTGVAPRRSRTARVDAMSLAGTGYTGEMGGELCVPAEAAARVWQSLIDAGATPCGLGARDTLRLETGLALWGADIDETTTPLEAGLEFAVSWDHDFIGKEALERQREEGASRRLVGLVTAERVIPRAGHRVRSGESEGTVTSGNLSPVLDTGIALAYLSPPVEVGAEAEIEVRGRWVPARVKKPPFHR